MTHKAVNMREEITEAAQGETMGRAEDVLAEAQRVVLRLCAERGCVPGGEWESLARAAYIEGRIDGLTWARDRSSL